MANGICPKCKALREMVETRSERKVKDGKGHMYKILTVTYRCASCNGFVNSRDIRVPIKKESMK
ncbi:MAG TPA: hypothetical protein DD429_08015 [Clostridiaceae bacterium]|nr:hypothetical protein [Clostridiaceae bacterium]